MILRHTFNPPTSTSSNRRLNHLCGALDEHLRILETGCQVKIAHRHEQFKIDGLKKDATRALEVLQAMYELADKPIEPETIQLMLATDAPLHPNTSFLQPNTSAASQGNGHSSDVLATRRADLQARSDNQAAYLANIASHDITFGIGPAGTGKTYLAVAAAVDALSRNSVQRIVLTRPAVEAGEKLGYLPGDLAQKVDPFLRPLYDALYELMGSDKVAKAFERGQLEIAPLAFMRGRTLNHAFVILDEAQNTTPEQMKMFLTRLGFASKCVVTGDVSQIDLASGQTSGLIDAERVLKRLDGIAVTNFTSRDVVRHPLVARIVEAYAAARKG